MEWRSKNKITALPKERVNERKGWRAPGTDAEAFMDAMAADARRRRGKPGKEGRPPRDAKTI